MVKELIMSKTGAFLFLQELARPPDHPRLRVPCLGDEKWAVLCAKDPSLSLCHYLLKF